MSPSRFPPPRCACYPQLKPFLSPQCSFYVPDVTVLREFTTQRLFFRQALQHISSNKLGCPADEVIALCALALQAIEGDYISDSATRHLIDTMKLIPDNVCCDPVPPPHLLRSLAPPARPQPSSTLPLPPPGPPPPSATCSWSR